MKKDVQEEKTYISKDTDEGESIQEESVVEEIPIPGADKDE